MRRVSVRFFIAICTFALGFAAAMLWVQSRDLAEPQKVSSQPPCESKVFLDSNADISSASDLPILDYCELANNPERYNGKIVRIRARLSGFIHGMVITDENCIGNQAAASYHLPTAEDIKQALKRARGSDNWFEAVNLIAVGKFEKVTPSNESDLIYDTASLRFEIMRVEKASKLR